MGNAADDRLNERDRPTRLFTAFPRYLMIDGKGRLAFLSLEEARTLYDEGWEAGADIREYVLLDDFSVRRMTHEEQAEIAKTSVHSM